MSTELREQVRTRIENLPAPPGDLAAVRRAGARIRLRRRAGGVVVAALVVGCAVTLTHLPDGDGHTDRGVDPAGPLDFSHGLRAYADPGNEIHLGGHTLPAAGLEALDTDAAATPYGVVFYDGGVPRLLPESGKIRALEPDATGGKFRPTAKADAERPWVAYGAILDGHPTVVVRNLRADRVVATREVSIDTVIDGIDSGTVFLRGAAGTTAWDVTTDRVRDLAGPDTRVADARNGVLLYTGPEPTGAGAAGWRLVKGPIDAELTFDGGHLLYWSDVLEPVGAGEPLTLDLPEPATWFAIDTDGSVLAAARKPESDATVYDCVLPSGRCDRLGPLPTTGGDPMFIGTDM
jgi:hypothetical protein